MQLTDAIQTMLETLAKDHDRYADAARLQANVFMEAEVERQPLLMYAGLDQSEMPSFSSKQTHWDSEKMLYQGLRETLRAQAGGREAAPSLRANMGCGIVPTLFGLEQELYDDKMPWLLQRLTKEQILEMKPGDLKIGREFEMGLSHMAYMAERIAGTGVHLYPMDIQGAFDTAHLVFGDEIFYEMYDDPAFVHHLMDLSCHAIFMAMDACLARCPGSDQTVYHYNALAMPRAKGGLKLSEDTSTLLGAEHIAEFVAPYIHRILSRYGGGYIHYCGVNEHLYQTVMNEPLAFGLNFGNPERHDMDQVLRDCATRRKVFYGIIPKKAGEDDAAYFRRVLSAATFDGRQYLLLSVTEEPQRCAAVADIWDQACGK